MMKTPPPEATNTVYPILRQIVNLIPPTPHPAEHLPRGGVCDAARHHASQWQELRGNPAVAERILELLAEDGPMRPSALRKAVGLQAEGVNMVEYQGLMVMGKSCADLCQAF